MDSELLQAPHSMLDQVPEALGNPLEIVLKVSERCNIACTYCYFFFSSDQSYKEHPAIIPLEKSDDVLAFIKRTLNRENNSALNVVFHGGEPLMAPHETLAHLINGVKAFQTDGLVATVNIMMQTNGLLLNDKNIAFMKKHGLGAGVSIDGDKAHHDTYRIDHKGRGTYDRAIAGYQRLAKSISDDGTLKPGILAVAHPQFDGHKIFNHFVNEIGCRNLNFLLPDYTYDDDIIDEDYIDGIEKFLIDVFQSWVDQNDPSIRIRFIDEIINPLYRDDAAEYSFANKLGYFKLLTISSDGTVAPEDTMKLIAPRFQNVGNVNDFETAADVYASDVFGELDNSMLNPPALCAACDWFGICAGDKTINRLSKERSLDNPSIYCKALKSLRIEIATWMVECGVPMEDIERRLKLARAGLFKEELQ